jgi:hypothetical protein
MLNPCRKPPPNHVSFHSFLVRYFSRPHFFVFVQSFEILRVTSQFGHSACERVDRGRSELLEWGGFPQEWKQGCVFRLAGRKLDKSKPRLYYNKSRSSLLDLQLQ